MAGGFDPILGPQVVGMIGSDGHLTKAARDAFTAQVVTLMVGGNKDGKGPKISSITGLPLPPVPGPPFPDPDRLLTHPTDPIGNLFWFDPSPLCLPTIPILADPDKDYQKIIVTGLYEPLVKMMNLNGNLAIFPIFDPTVAFPSIKIPDIPAFIIGLGIALPTPPALPAFAAKFKIDVGDLKAFVIPPPIPIPSLPSLPPLPIPPKFDFIVFPKIFLNLLTIPLKLIDPGIFIPKIAAAFPPDPIKLFGVILDLCIDLIKLAFGPLLGVILPKLLVATLTIILQNLVSMLVVDFIGLVLGAGGICKTAAGLLALV